jgi:ABC-type dipeptide/oligopeptide/nickel transport system permease subunit
LKKVIWFILITWIGILIFVPHLAPFTDQEQNFLERLQSASWKHWMGTDALGRDLFSRILYSSRISMGVGIAPALLALFFGTTIGLIAGYVGQWIDALLMRTLDLLCAFPTLLLAILLSIAFGRGLTGILITLSLTSWMTQTRFIRGLVLKLKYSPAIEAARSIGLRHDQILLRYMLPHLIRPSLGSLSLLIPANLMNESILSFIGLGLQPPFMSWGTLAHEGFQTLQSYPHLLFFPGFCLFITLLAFHLIQNTQNERSSFFTNQAVPTLTTSPR